MCSHRTGPDPLLNNLWTVWDNMQAFRTVLEEWLVRKIEDDKVKLDIDIIWYKEALSKWESGMNDAQEEALLARFPPADNILLDSPLVVINSRYRIILWYIPDALISWVQNDMFLATIFMGDLLRKSITNGKSGSWRTSWTNFHQAETPGLTPVCINITPYWFQ
ncbi:hypothetical protein EV424DRAFT_1551057 [Suillus variegatus]|nr:hypothetical protein EV424DRAFT_1551057 [Suillus variegatus]